MLCCLSGTLGARQYLSDIRATAPELGGDLLLGQASSPQAEHRLDVLVTELGVPMRDTANGSVAPSTVTLLCVLLRCTRAKVRWVDTDPVVTSV
jgi:hypothetical protein